MYVSLSNSMIDASKAGVEWVEALADAEKLFAEADKSGKRQWAGVIEIIRQAIERGELWPGE